MKFARVLSTCSRTLVRDTRLDLLIWHIFTAFYFHILNHDPKNPDWAERDRLFLSNGHIVPVRYATMAHAGYFPLRELPTLRKFGSRLQGHPERENFQDGKHFWTTWLWTISSIWLRLRRTNGWKEISCILLYE